MTEHRSYPIRSVPPPEPMTLPGRSGDEVSFFTLSSLSCIPFVLISPYFQVVSVRVDDLRSLYSRAWNSYAFLTFVAHDPADQDRACWRFLRPRAPSSTGGSDSLQSNPSVEQVVAGARPPPGPSRFGSTERTSPPPEGEGSASRRRHRE